MTTSPLSQLTEHFFSSLSQKPVGIRRLFHGRGKCFEGLEQITIDWLGGQVLVTLFKSPTEGYLTQLKEELATWPTQAEWLSHQPTSLLLQHRYNAEDSNTKCDIDCLWGDYQETQIADEDGLTFQLDIGKNQNIGLFLDMRYGRQWVKENSKNKRVLNLFSYTCGFSVAAISGDADHVVNLDMAKGALNRGRENHRLNHHDLSNVSFFSHDIFKSWGKIKKYGLYDLIIIDPPTFQKGSFALTKDYQKILRRLPDLLTTNGQVLACVNDPTLPAQFLIDGMNQEAPELVFQYRLDNPPEFPDIDIESGLKALVFAK